VARSSLIGEYVGRTYIQSKHRPLFVISHLHRRARLPDRLPHDPPHGRKISRNSPFKALQTELDAEAHAPLLDEIAE
jgi:hypothetical protein